MREKPHLNTQGKRLMRAIALVALVVFAAPIASGLHNAAEAASESETAQAQIDARSIIGNGNPDEMLTEIEKAASVDQGQVDELFRAEIGLLPGARDIRTTADGSVVGYLVDNDAARVLDELNTFMEGNGWSAVPLGSVEGMTFIKEEGGCTWALATCTSVGNATSVVFRLLRNT